MKIKTVIVAICLFAGLSAYAQLGEAILDQNLILLPKEFEPDVVAEDGAWTWFNDERAIWHQSFLYVGYVLSDGRYGVSRFNPSAGKAKTMIISTEKSRETDDHNNPSFTVLPDDRLLIMYSKHNTYNQFYYRISKTAQPTSEKDWGPEMEQQLSERNTYSNTFLLKKEGGRIYNFHRNINFNPTISISEDKGQSWGEPIHFISAGKGKVRPYPKYFSNHEDRIDLIYTDGHPRDIDNSIFHMYYQKAEFKNSAGEKVKDFADLPIQHDKGERGSEIYTYSEEEWQGNEGPDNWIPKGRAWTWDIAYQKNGNPVVAFQVQIDNGENFRDDRIYYYYAYWTGKEWKKKLIAKGGRPLYPREDDYGGGMAIDPDNPGVIYISSNAHSPFDLANIYDTLLSERESYYIWRGDLNKDGAISFSWKKVVGGSGTGAIRPIVPENHGFGVHLLWLEGEYRTYKDFSTSVMTICGDYEEVFGEKKD